MKIKCPSIKYYKNDTEENYYDNENNKHQHNKRKHRHRHHKRHHGKDYKAVLDNEHNDKRRPREKDSSKKRYKKFLVFENNKIVEYAELVRNYYNNQNRQYIKNTDFQQITPENKYLKNTCPKQIIFQNSNLKEADFEEIISENNTLEDTDSKQIIPGNKNKITFEDCKTTAVSEMLPLCENTPYTSKTTRGPVTIKVPVVITECKVIITVQSSLKLQDTILDIKDIGKSVYLNKFKLAPDFENYRTNTGIVFMDGFIKKDIEYISREQVKKELLKYASVEIPFKCATRVTFKTPPKFIPTASNNKTDILETDVKICSTPEKDFKLTQSFNEKVFCELINSEIVETDILENSENQICKSSLNRDFHKITEKVVLLLTIKLLQNQNVEIPQ